MPDAVLMLDVSSTACHAEAMELMSRCAESECEVMLASCVSKLMLSDAMIIRFDECAPRCRDNASEACMRDACDASRSCGTPGFSDICAALSRTNPVLKIRVSVMVANTATHIHTGRSSFTTDECDRETNKESRTSYSGYRTISPRLMPSWMHNQHNRCTG